MARSKEFHSNFSAGALSPELLMRQDTEQYQNGAKRLDNFRCLIGGGAKRRPGSWHQADMAATGRAEAFVVNQDIKYVIVFSDGRMDAFAVDLADGTLTAAGGLGSCPWTGDIWRKMDMTQSGNTAFLTHPSMPTQVLSRTGDASWAIARFAFFTGPAGRPEQPYLKLAAQAVTLQPSALTGSITLTLGGTGTAYFGSNRVGEYLRYQKKTCLITAVAADGLSVTATVIETLPDTLTLTVSDTSKFAVGEVVEGDVTSAKGVVTSIADATHLNVVITDKLTIFTTSDKL